MTLTEPEDTTSTDKPTRFETTTGKSYFPTQSGSIWYILPLIVLENFSLCMLLIIIDIYNDLLIRDYKNAFRDESLHFLKKKHENLSSLDTCILK